MSIIKKYILPPKVIINFILNHLGPYIKNDATFLKYKWNFSSMNYKLNLENPKTFNEKLQWLKIYDRRPIYTTMVDKYEAKKYIAEIIGDEYIIPTLGVWNNPEDINFDLLPNQFVLKVTHDSGGVIICKDKAFFDKKRAIAKLKKAMKRSYYYQNREWPYKNVPHKIIAEKYIGENLQDFRFYCFNGEPKLIYSYTNISESDGSKPEPSYCDIMDINWNPVLYRQNSPARSNVPKPVYLGDMIECARKLSQGIPFLRVDFYECGRVLAGELTFYPGSGLSQFRPVEWDYKLGSWLQLPLGKNNEY